MEEKIAVVVGASGGIGSAISKKLAEEGFFTYVCCRNQTKGEEVVKQIVADGGKAETLVFDVQSKESVKEAVNNLPCEKVDLLVNSAGVLIDDLIYNVKMENWDFVYHTNFESVIMVYNEFEAKLKKAESPMVALLCSISGVRARSGQMCYGVTKSMLINWVKVMGGKKNGITYFAISPGPVETEMIKSSKWYEDKKSVKRIPLSRYAKPEEIGDFITLLSQNTTLFQNGSNVILDGGFLQTTKE